MTRTAPLRIALISGLLASGTALAFQPLITDDTGTQGAGGNQLEFAWEHASEKSGASTTRADAIPVVFTHGFTDALDLAVALPWVQTKVTGNPTESGTGNPSLAMKWRFHEEKEGWSMALKPEIAFPVSASKENKLLGDHGTALNLSLLMSRETSFGEMHINAGFGRYLDGNSGSSDYTTYHLSAAPVWKLSETTRVALDVGLDHDGAARDTSYYGLLGLIYAPNEHIDLALGVQRTYSVPGTSDIWAATVGVTWHLK